MTKIDWTKYKAHLETLSIPRSWTGIVRSYSGCKICNPHYRVAPAVPDHIGPSPDNKPQRIPKWEAKLSESKMSLRDLCPCMVDVFEDGRGLERGRRQVWRLINGTPEVNWLLFTCHSQNISKFAPWSTNWPENASLGLVADYPRPPLEIPIPVSSKNDTPSDSRSPWIDDQYSEDWQICKWQSEIEWIRVGTGYCSEKFPKVNPKRKTIDLNIIFEYIVR